MNQQIRDVYYLNLTRIIADSSKCLSRKVGTLIVKDDCIISTGRNGPARGVKHCDERNMYFYSEIVHKGFVAEQLINKECPRKLFGYKSGEGLELCQAAHAEINAIIQCARMGHVTKDATIYINLNPCKNCVIAIINSGIKRVVYPKPEKHYDRYAQILLKESKIEVIEMEV